MSTFFTPVLIGIGGGTASGKSTLAKMLLEAFPKGTASLFPTDNYYKDLSHLTPCQRHHINFDHPDALEMSLLVSNLTELRECKPAQLPVYDSSTHTRRPETITCQPSKVLIVEGILALYPAELRAIYNLMLFVDAPDELRLQRRMGRDIRERGRTKESVLAQWNETVLPMHKMFCETGRQYAHQTVDGTSMEAMKNVVQEILARSWETS